MAAFQFQARDSLGRAQTGVLEAPFPEQAAAELRNRGYRVVAIRPAVAPLTASQVLKSLNPLNHLPPRSIDIELSCKQLAVMLRGGVTLLNSLQSLSQQASRRSMARVWDAVATRIQEGASFAVAMQEARCFPPLLLRLVRVGEQTGNLDQAVERAAMTMEARRNILASLFTALAYPAIVVIAAISVTIYMVTGVIPKLKVFLQSMGRKLPAMTQFLVDFSDAVHDYFLYGVITLVVLTITLIVLYSQPTTRLVIDRWILRVPIIGHLFRLAGTAAFARALGILVRSGVTLLESLRTVEDILHNRYLSARVAAARQAVIQGRTLAEPLATAYAFTPMLARMVAVGEATGTIDDILDEVARFHESQLQSAIKRLSVLVEPAIILVVGGIVGFVYIAFFLALFSAGGVG